MRWNRQAGTGGAQRSMIIKSLWLLFLMLSSHFAVASSIVADPRSLDLGSVIVGEQSAPQEIILTTTDTAYDVSIDAMTVTEGFILTDDCPAALTANNPSCTINVVFAPISGGVVTGLFQVVYSDPFNATNGVDTVNISGIGISSTLVADPGSLDFGSVIVGQQGAFQQISLRSQSLAEITIDRVEVTEGYVINHDCPVILASGAECTVDVAFAPGSTGVFDGSLQVDYQVLRSFFNTSATLSGVGIPVPQADLTVTPGSLDFGGIVLDHSSAAQSITVSNTGDGVMGLNPVAVSGDFSQTNDCSNVLNAGDSCVVDVIFNPTTIGDVVGLLEVSGNDANSESSLAASADLVGVGLSVTQANLTVTPGFLDFGGVVVNGSSAVQSVTISNTGDGNMSLNPVTVSGEFSQTNDCSDVLNAGDSCVVDVIFNPTTIGDIVGLLQVLGNDALSDASLAASADLVGVGLSVPQANLTVTPSFLDFGEVQINHDSTAQSITISNVGNGSMSLNPVTVSGVFSQTNNCSNVLNAGESCLVNLIFSPTAVGNAVGLLRVSGQDANSQVSLTASAELRGIGFQVAIGVSPTALSMSGTLPDAISDGQSVTISNPNNYDLLLAPLVVNGPFIQSNDCGVSVPPQGSCVVEIVFSPQAAGTFDGELLITVTLLDQMTPVTSTVALSGSTMEQSTAEDILSQVDVGDNPNVESVVVVISDTCTSGRAGPRLQADCNAVIDAAAAGDPGVANALLEITPERATKSSSMVEQGGQVQMSNVASRMTALRNGATGISVGGLSFNIDGKQLSATQLASLGQANIRGGSAGDDEGLFGSRLGGFITGTIATGDKEGTELDSGLDFSTSGVTAGLDYRFTEHFVLGGAIGYMSTDSDLDNNGGNLDATGYTLTAYGTYYGADSYYIDFSAAYGANDFDQQRKVAYELQNQGVIDQKAKASYDGDMFTLSVGSGYDFNSGSWVFGPRVNLDYIKTDIDGFTERMSDPLSNGGGWATSMEDTDQTWLTLKLGGKASYAYSTTWGVLTPYASADWLHEFKNDSQLFQGGFAADPGSLNFQIMTEDPDRNYFRVNLGVAAVFQNGIIGYLDYDTILSNDRWDRQTISAGLRMEF